MMNFYKILSWCFILMLVLPSGLFGQTETKSVVIVNGGDYSDPNDFVTVANYNPQTMQTQTIATIHTQSAQGLLVSGGFAYVAAQDSLARINIQTGEIDAIVALPGVNKLALYENKLIVSRQYPVTSGFVQIRNAGDLELITTITEVSDESWDIVVAGDTAYVSVAGGWAATEGKLAVINMSNNAFVREMNFGSDAQGIGPSFKAGNELWFVCKTPWGGSSGNVMKYDLTATAATFYPVEHAIGKAAGIAGGKLFLTVDGNVGVFNLSAGTLETAALITNPFPEFDITALTLDTVANNIYVNYSSWSAPDGTGKIYNLSGEETGGYQVGVSAEEVAVNYIDVTGMDTPAVNGNTFAVFPNPCSDYLNVSGITKACKWSVYDWSGRLLMDGSANPGVNSRINVRQLPAGAFVLKVSDAGSVQMLKFVHQ